MGREADRGEYIVTEEIAGLEVGQYVQIDRDEWRTLIDAGLLRQVTAPHSADDEVAVLGAPTRAQLGALEEPPPE